MLAGRWAKQMQERILTCDFTKRRSELTAISPKRLSTSAPIRAIAYELKDQLERRYGSQLKGVVLFGSYARGEETEGSDIDIAIILEDFDHACTEIERTGDLISLLSLKFDTLISLAPIKERDWLLMRTSLISNIRRDGVVL